MTHFPHTKSDKGWRNKLFIIIFKADTPIGKLFDMLLIVSIIASVVVVMLDSVSSIKRQIGEWLIVLELFFTFLFTVEYILRLLCVDKPKRYALSFFGIVDLLAILPTYLSLIVPGTHYLVVIRILRVLRVFRVLKLAKYIGEEYRLVRALWESRRKICIFLLAVLTLVVIIGSVMYLIEGPENGFTSIPQSIYWSIVTLTTVGYGDISPQTELGKSLAAVVMILGYAIIAVPTGIVTAQMIQPQKLKRSMLTCSECAAGGHDSDARFCRICGTKL